jgi:hypothetical protein
MKTQNSLVTIDIFKTFALSNEEMINIRGGENEGIIKVVVPPIVI